MYQNLTPKSQQNKFELEIPVYAPREAGGVALSLRLLKAVERNKLQ